MKVLGFDMGDGESALTLFDDDSSIEPRVVPLNGRASIISAVGVRKGQIVIGEDASVLSGALDVQARFKARYLTDPSVSGVVRMFAQGVLSQLMREEPALMAQVTSTVVGCPAGWGQGRRDQYAALMESAGFPNVRVVPEPRAAFLYVRHARGLRIDPKLMRTSAMVVDVGSSTTDFAYIVDGRQQDQSLFGDTNLGGGLIDELILEDAVDCSADAAAIRRVFKECPAWKSYCELQVRRLKEAYFLDEEKWKTQPLKQQLFICYDDTLTLNVELNAARVEKLIHAPVAQLGARSFVKCLQDALAAASKASAANPPRAIILTGGASRMAFLREEVKKAFPESTMIMCPEPECSIARGLSYAGSVDEKLRIFREEIASLAHGQRLNTVVTESVHELYKPLADAIFSASEECAVEGVRLWRGGVLDTIEDLEAYCEREIEKAISGGQMIETVKKPMTQWLERLLGKLEGELEALCVRCGIPPERMSLGGAQVKTGVGVKISLTDAMGMDILTGLLGVVMATVAAAVCGGGGLALVASGPLGIIVGIIIGILLVLLGKQGMEHVVKKTKLPPIVRQIIRDGMIRFGMARQRGKIESEIIKALADPTVGFSGRICASLASTLGIQLEEMAKNAEMSIEA